MRSYQRSIKVTKSLLIYSQIHQIDNDKQTISLNFNYDFKGNFYPQFDNNNSVIVNNKLWFLFRCSTLDV